MALGSGAARPAVVGAFAHAGQHAGVVGEDQVMAVLVKFMEVEQPLFGGQALDEGQVGLAVLHAVFAVFRLAGHGKAHIGNTPLVAQGINDGERVDLLEDTRVLAQGEAPQGRAQHQGIEGAAMAPVAPAKLTDDAMNSAQRLTVLPEGEACFAVQQVGGIEAAVAAGQVEGQFEGLGEGFTVGEVDHGHVVNAGER